MSPARTRRFRKFRKAGMQNDLNHFYEVNAEYDLFKTEAQELGLFFSPSTKNRKLDPAQVERAMHSALAMWKPLIQTHPVFKMVSDDPHAFAFYLLEQSIFVSQAAYYIEAGAQTAGRTWLGKTLRELAADEANHYHSLIQSLRLNKKSFFLHDPSAGTVALVAHLFHLASKDPESFVFSLSLFETDRSDLTSIKKFYSQHKRTILFDSTAFINHHKEDVALGHVCLWKEHLSRTKDVDSDRASKIIADLHTTKHMLNLWLDSIERDSRFINREFRNGKIDINGLIRPKPVWGSV